MHDSSTSDAGMHERSLVECLTEAVHLAVDTKNIEWLRGLMQLLNQKQKDIHGAMETAEHNEELETADNAFAENE